jgi:hypothetical protein
MNCKRSLVFDWTIESQHTLLRLQITNVLHGGGEEPVSRVAVAHQREDPAFRAKRSLALWLASIRSILLRGCQKLYLSWRSPFAKGRSWKFRITESVNGHRFFLWIDHSPFCTDWWFSDRFDTSISFWLWFRSFQNHTSRKGIYFSPTEGLKPKASRLNGSSVTSELRRFATTFLTASFVWFPPDRECLRGRHESFQISAESLKRFAFSHRKERAAAMEYGWSQLIRVTQTITLRIQIETISFIGFVETGVKFCWEWCNELILHWWLTITIGSWSRQSTCIWASSCELGGTHIYSCFHHILRRSRELRQQLSAHNRHESTMFGCHWVE